jgi:hypothetical protein
MRGRFRGGTRRTYPLRSIEAAEMALAGADTPTTPLATPANHACPQKLRIMGSSTSDSSSDILCTKTPSEISRDQLAHETSRYLHTVQAVHSQLTCCGETASLSWWRHETRQSVLTRNRSCEPCRISKVKCDHGTPTCTKCQTRGMVDQVGQLLSASDMA